MKIKTTLLKDAVSKVIKGAGMNNLIPLTSMMGIRLENSNLILSTTDMTNTLEVTIPDVATGILDITIDIDKFSKLIAKTTSEEVELSTIDNILNIKANGKYKIPVITDEEGEVTFPRIKNTSEVLGKVNSIELTNMYNINKCSLAKTMESPYLTGYHCSDKVITTDANVITFNNINLFKEVPNLLISSQMMRLLTLFSGDIDYSYESGILTFHNDTMTLQGAELEGIDEYPVNEINAYLDESFNSSCKVPKELLMSVLDRLSLFIEPYDNNGAYFTFNRTGINVSSRKLSSDEVINYVDSENFESFKCLVDINLFKEQISVNPSDTIHLYYGNENALKIVTGKITQIVALLEDAE